MGNRYLLIKSGQCIDTPHVHVNVPVPEYFRVGERLRAGVRAGENTNYPGLLSSYGNRAKFGIHSFSGQPLIGAAISAEQLAVVTPTPPEGAGL